MIAATTLLQPAALPRIEPDFAIGILPGDPAPDRGGDIGMSPNAFGFDLMHAVYRSTGGLARGDDLARRLGVSETRDFARIAGLVVSGGMLGFEWQRIYWIPMFQFDRSKLSLKPAARRAAKVLSAEFDGWTLAAWFAQPNSWLNNACPVDVLDADADAVLYAARADQFLWTGRDAPADSPIRCMPRWN